MGSAFPTSGTVFEDRYKLRSIIGRGGFAQIYLAERIDLGREVALKILNPQLRQDLERGEVVAERFRREAKLVGSLRDPHTITMHDYGQTADGLLYMVFEYIDGDSLRDHIADHGALAPRRVAKILRQCLLSLQEAHALGVLHRDIKPANIMLYEHVGRTDQIKVLDFGIAKSVLGDHQDHTADLTNTGIIIGTPRYMAPEQLRGSDLSPATDLYSLGLVTYELLTGHKAINADSVVSIITQQVSNGPVRLPEQLDVPEDLRALVHGMLEKRLERRTPSADEALEALERIDLDHLSDEVGKPLAPGGDAAMLAADAFDHKELGEAPAEPEPRRGTQSTVTALSKPKRHRLSLLIGCVLLLAGAAVAYGVSLERDDAPAVELSEDDPASATSQREPSNEETTETSGGAPGPQLDEESASSEAKIAADGKNAADAGVAEEVDAAGDERSKPPAPENAQKSSDEERTAKKSARSRTRKTRRSSETKTKSKRAPRQHRSSASKETDDDSGQEESDDGPSFPALDEAF